jgi:hypothetical protein
MHTMTLYAQADLWQHGAATFAALFMEGEIRSPDTEDDRTDVLFFAVMNRGLPLATDLARLTLGPRRGWAIHLNSAGALTLTWPHTQPLLLDAPLNLPTGWREAAAEHSVVLLFVGDRLGLRDHTEGNQVNLGKHSPQAAQRGELAAGAIAYPHPLQQQEPRLARQTDPQPRSRAGRWTRTYRWQRRPTLSTTHHLSRPDSLRRSAPAPQRYSPIQTGEPMSPHPFTFHPQWCDPRCCEPTDVNVQHSSAPTTETFADETWHFTLVSVDEYACPRETSPELIIDVTRTTYDSEDARYVLRLEEVHQLADRLMTEYHRAQFLRKRNEATRWPRSIRRLRAVWAAVGWAITPRRWTRRVRTSLTNRT